MKLFSKSGLGMGLVVAATALLAACGGGDDDLDDRLDLADPQIRVMHVIPPLPVSLNVDVLQNGAKTNLSNVQYKAVSKYWDVDTGNQLISINNAGSNTELSRAVIDAATGHKYTVVALPGEGVADLMVIDDPYDKGLISDKARVRALNVSRNAQNIDVYLTAPETDLTAVAPTFAAVGYKQAVPASRSDSRELEGGTYRLRVTTAGSKTVIFDSGSVSLDDNADWLITTIPAEGIGAVLPNNIKVLVAKANDDSQTAVELTKQ
ncbi:DUF4397 domain-containing protein [Paracidovorax citrulli]